MDARRPVVIEKYSIHCLRIPFVRSISSLLGLAPCCTTMTIPVLNCR